MPLSYSAELLKALWSSLKAITVDVPGEIIGLASGIKELISNEKALSAFEENIYRAIGDFVGQRADSLNTCLNQYEKINSFAR